MFGFDTAIVQKRAPISFESIIPYTIVKAIEPGVYRLSSVFFVLDKLIFL
jgi:hypothetical protein